MTQLLPFAVFSVLILAVTVGVVVGVQAESTRLSMRLNAGDLHPADVRAIGAGLVQTWLLSLIGFFAFTGMTVGLTVKVHRFVQRRVRALLELCVEAADGKIEIAPPAETDDPLSRLEAAILRLGVSVRQRGETLERDHARARVDGQLQRAFDHCDDEADTLAVVRRALDTLVPETPAEVLVADSSRSHLRRVTHSSHGAAGCPVERPFQCAAVRRGHTTTFDASDNLDACPKLRDRECGPCSAVCSPVTVMGQTVGVLHVLGQPHAPPDADQIRFVDAIARQAGTRLGVLRTLATTQLQAATDPLTGLLNRRSFEEQAAAILREDPGAHAVIMCDLDHFKRLNDTHGHEAGDRALRLFCETAKGALRPGDLLARYGGEEFVFLLPRCEPDNVPKMVERVRARLRAATERYSGPAFTASFGAACFGIDGDDLSELLGRADGALYEAKQRGRDRLVVCGRVTDQVAA